MIDMKDLSDVCDSTFKLFKKYIYFLVNGFCVVRMDVDLSKVAFTVVCFFFFSRNQRNRCKNYCIEVHWYLKRKLILGGILIFWIINVNIWRVDMDMPKSCIEKRVEMMCGAWRITDMIPPNRTLHVRDRCEG